MTNDLAAEGIAVRKHVLGEAYVEASMNNANGFNADFQNLLNTYCWGAVWTRDGLPKETRSLITLALLVALNQPAELRNHVRGALNNGVTVDEIREVLLHTTVYCGVPAASLAFNAAMEELKSLGVAL